MAKQRTPLDITLHWFPAEKRMRLYYQGASQIADLPEDSTLAEILDRIVADDMRARVLAAFCGLFWIRSTPSAGGTEITAELSETQSEIDRLRSRIPIPDDFPASGETEAMARIARYLARMRETERNHGGRPRKHMHRSDQRRAEAAALRERGQTKITVAVPIADADWIVSLARHLRKNGAENANTLRKIRGLIEQLEKGAEK